MIQLPARAIELTLPLVVVAALALAAVVPGSRQRTTAEIPVTGTVTDPCTGESVTFGGTARVVVSSRPDGAAGFHLEVLADLSEAEAVGESGTPYALSGSAAGEVTASPPLPTTVSVDGAGSIVTRGTENGMSATIRIQLTVTEDGIVTPTGAAEVTSLACRE